MGGAYDFLYGKLGIHHSASFTDETGNLLIRVPAKFNDIDSTREVASEVHEGLSRIGDSQHDELGVLDAFVRKNFHSVGNTALNFNWQSVIVVDHNYSDPVDFKNCIKEVPICLLPCTQELYMDI